MNDGLLQLERRFWEASSAGDGDFYRRNATADALYVFPGPTGVLTSEDCAAVVDGNDTPWDWFRLEQPRFLELAADVVLLTYTSHAQHRSGQPFAMRVTTIYRARQEGWKLAFHQQTMAPRE